MRTPETGGDLPSLVSSGRASTSVRAAARPSMSARRPFAVSTTDCVIARNFVTNAGPKPWDLPVPGEYPVYAVTATLSLIHI